MLANYIFLQITKTLSSNHHKNNFAQPRITHSADSSKLNTRHCKCFICTRSAYWLKNKIRVNFCSKAPVKSTPHQPEKEVQTGSTIDDLGIDPELVESAPHCSITLTDNGTNGGIPSYDKNLSKQGKLDSPGETFGSNFFCFRKVHTTFLGENAVPP